ncbi:DUF7668 domain-containing protein [Parvularcula maris]|uniref:DUF7668 domain-containing protein n=1 Tax=Parvularcula maris TaxID=2965077 RepID=UPI003F7E9E06
MLLPSKVVARELPVPTMWRPQLKQLADDMVFGRQPSGPAFRQPSSDILDISSANISAYPDMIGELRDASWLSSIHVWNGAHWEVLLDLTNVAGAVTDLVLHVSVLELNGAYEFEPGMIYVP